MAPPEMFIDFSAPSVTGQNHAVDALISGIVYDFVDPCAPSIASRCKPRICQPQLPLATVCSRSQHADGAFFIDYQGRLKPSRMALVMCFAMAVHVDACKDAYSFYISEDQMCLRYMIATASLDVINHIPVCLSHFQRKMRVILNGRLHVAVKGTKRACTASITARNGEFKLCFM